jgi:hypothetical protein
VNGWLSSAPSETPRVKQVDPARLISCGPTVLGTTFSLWTSTIPQLLAVAALVHLPRFALRCIFLGHPSNPVLVALQSGFESLDFIVVPAFVSVFAVYFVFQRLRSEPADLGRSIALGFRRILTSLGITAILGAPLFVLVYLSVHMSQEIVEKANRTDPGSAVASAGILLLITSAILLYLAISPTSRRG